MCTGIAIEASVPGVFTRELLKCLCLASVSTGSSLDTVLSTSPGECSLLNHQLLGTKLVEPKFSSHFWLLKEDGLKRVRMLSPGMRALEERGKPWSQLINTGQAPVLVGHIGTQCPSLGGQRVLTGLKHTYWSVKY